MHFLTQEEYNKLDHKTPYSYQIQRGEQFLFFFGERHLFDPKNKQWKQLKEFWSDFLNSTKNSKKIAFVEAGKVPAEESEEKAILESGGTGLVSFLAHQADVEIFCPEPGRQEEIIELEKDFSREQIEYYYFARIVNQWWKIPDPRPEFEAYVNKFLERDKRVNGWENFDFSVENMKVIHKKLFGNNLDINNRDFFREITAPIELKSVINKVVRASGDIREKYIANNIFNYWNVGYSIFVEYGASHAVIQEPLLKEELSKAAPSLG